MLARSAACQRGQSLLEALIVVGVVVIATTIATLGFHLLGTNERPNEAALIALDAAENAATELLAATAYDPSALAAVTNAQWQVSAPTAPAGAPSSESSPIALSLTTSPNGASQSIVIQYSVGSLKGNLPFTLRSLTVPPGSIIDATAAPSSP
jgi:type II secretory pathway pseudopilin PulG